MYVTVGRNKVCAHVLRVFPLRRFARQPPLFLGMLLPKISRQFTWFGFEDCINFLGWYCFVDYEIQRTGSNFVIFNWYTIDFQLCRFLPSFASEMHKFDMLQTLHFETIVFVTSFSIFKKNNYCLDVASKLNSIDSLLRHVKVFLSN